MTSDAGIECAPPLSAETMNRLIGDLVVSPALAESLFQRRTRMLGIFMAPESPQELKELFSSSVKAMEVGHGVCQRFANFADFAIDSLAYSKAERILFAGRAIRCKNSEEALRVEVVDIHQRTDIALARAFCGLSDLPTLSAVLEAEFINSSPAELLSARLYATNVLNYEALICQYINSMAAVSLVASICRSMFYVSIVDEEGSQLELEVQRKALKEKIEGTVEDIAWGLIGNVPLIGAYIIQIREAFQWIALMRDQEKLLRDAHASMVERYQVAKSFIETYQKCLIFWAEWAMAIQEAVVEMGGAYRDLLAIAESESVAQ